MVRKIRRNIRDAFSRLPSKVYLEDLVVDSISKIVDTYFTSAKKLKVGSILYCNLAVAFEHTGIYVGNNRVVHLNGNGKIEEVSLNRFVNRLDGRNPAISIYCAVDCSNEPISDRLFAERALKMVGTRRDYNLILDNCHKFTYYCMTGKTLPVVTFQTIETTLAANPMFHGWHALEEEY